MKPLILILFFTCTFLKNSSAQDTLHADFVGGQQMLTEYLSKNIHYPPDAKTLLYQGKVTAAIIINEQGHIVDYKIKQGIIPSMDGELIRVLSKVPTWKPATVNGKPVKDKMFVSVNYDLGLGQFTLRSFQINAMTPYHILDELPLSMESVVFFQIEKRYNKALDKLNEIMKNDPTNSDYLVIKGILYHEKLDNETECKILKQAQEQSKIYPYSKPGTTLLVNTMIRKACNDFVDVAIKDSTHLEMYNVTDETPKTLLPIVKLQQDKHYKKAHEALDKLIAQEPKNIDIIVYKALLFIEEKKYALACDVLFKVQDIADTDGYTKATTKEGVILLLVKYCSQ